MKLMAIDGNSLVNRAYYGVRPLSAGDGTPTNAVYGFLNMYLKLLGDIEPDGVCVCFDLKAKTFRHKMYDGYKAQRKPMPEELAAQIPLVKQVLDLMGVSRLELEGYEADDLLGTLAHRFSGDGNSCVIVTGDRDSLQYIAQGAQVALVTTRMGLTQTEVYDEQLFEEKYSGLHAGRIVDLKAIMGDKSDNIPGVPGIGEKGAMDLLLRFGSLQGVYDNLETGQFTPSVRKKLTEGRELAFLSYDLAKGVTDAPVEVQPGDGQLELKPMDKGGLFDFLNRLELRSIIKRLDLSPQDHSDDHGPAFEEKPYELIEDGGRLAALLDRGDAAVAFSEDMGLMAFDCGEGVYVSGRDYAGEGYDKAVKELLLSGRYTAHDAKPLALYALSAGADPGTPDFDTSIAAYLMAPTSNDFSLEGCALSALSVSLKS